MGTKEEDNKRRQVKEAADRCDFQDAEMKKLIKHPDFTIARMKVQANRLVANADEHAPENVRKDAKNADELLKLMQRLGL